MTFRKKADYPGPYDGAGIPMLNYHGAIGLQYNPIAVAQWGLGNLNAFLETGREERLSRALTAADWLVVNLEGNRHGVPVWHHQFDWEYRARLRAPWYSALAQGQGISLLARVSRVTRQAEYWEAAERAFLAFVTDVRDGGVTIWTPEGDVWFEEYIVDPPSHILNGFMWATWGVYDYMLLTGKRAAEELFSAATRTLLRHLARYDVGYWSLYELSPTRLPMLASPFYHRLHVVQLEVMYRLTGEGAFMERARRWAAYARDPVKRWRALVAKVAFKLLYY